MTDLHQSPFVSERGLDHPVCLDAQGGQSSIRDKAIRSRDAVMFDSKQSSRLTVSRAPIQDIYRSKFFVHLNRAITRADNDDIQSSRGGVEIGGAMIKRAAKRRHARWKGAEPLKRTSLGQEPEVAPGPRETLSAASSPSLAADAARVSPPSHEPHPFELASSFGASRFGRGMMDGAWLCASEKTAVSSPTGRETCIALASRPLCHRAQGVDA